MEWRVLGDGSMCRPAANASKKLSHVKTYMNGIKDGELFWVIKEGMSVILVCHPINIYQIKNMATNSLYKNIFELILRR